ncbi:hypothetical protein MSAS_08360 [Mycobacterium saskatchewanense]|uniref:Secreted protein n=1 Tax=Mycobacterium saskatchewanense TaxID=220927 RepID=A0AAJ3TTR4_9MYCO|nr:hypothetical protein [Mycobacterium saskatchewanense]ORW69013.1 hypothetical protein AWC23_19855 [Mycobacterium saskatchewanense]BBX61662.1 hypothetical protein MSAS_08360 [Mycobacterium saskatchewanense]
MNVVSRIALVWIAVAALVATLTAGSAAADPPPTQVITAVAVGPGGQPINGYQEAPPQGNVATVSDCTTSSPSAVADNIYSCSPSAADAATCWPSTPGSLLCVDNPWDMRLHRVNYTGPLPPVQHPSEPTPFALTLDDGTRCLARNGGAWGGRTDGYVGFYGCGADVTSVAVLCLPDQPPGTCIDRSGPVWSVKVGPLGAPGNDRFPPPQTRTITTAWFAGT